MHYPHTSAVLATAPSRTADALIRDGGLTPRQIDAVMHGTGPLVIFAGPGAGKTKTLTYRVARLVMDGTARPDQIVAVTFTVRAASEMRMRLTAPELLGEELSRGLTVSTFHSLCARLLRAHPAPFGRTDAYTIYDQAEITKLVNGVLSDRERVHVQAHVASCGLAPAGEVMREISLAKNRLWDAGRYEQESGHPHAALVGAVWRELEVELRACNAFDFDDLLVATTHLLGSYEHLRAHYRKRWPWLLVDEYQDTNATQAALVYLLAGAHGNVTVVGDDDQALYRFRAAEVDNILSFGEAFPSHQQIVLVDNWRSRAEVLNAAMACVSHNPRRVHKELNPIYGAGGVVQCPQFATDREEAEWIAREIVDATAAGIAGAEIMILCRNAFPTQTLQRTLAAWGIPHRVLGALGLYERGEVRDALAYLALLANACDSQAFRRAVAAPKRGVGPASATAIVNAARARADGDLIAASADPEMAGAVRNHKARQALLTFGAELERVRRELWAGRSIGHTVVQALMIEGGLVSHYTRRRDSARDPDAKQDAERVLEDLRSLCRAASSYDEQHPDGASLIGLLEQAAGLNSTEVEGPDDRVTVSTIHRAKGTEAHLVIVIGCEERLLPSWRSLEESDTTQLEEERRIFYVAATRAKIRLILSRCAERNGRPTDGPSRFLFEAGLI